MKLLTQDVAELKPSIFVAVPRVLERIQGGLSAKLKGKPWIVQVIMNLALKWKMARIRAGASVTRVSHGTNLAGLSKRAVRQRSWAGWQCMS